MPIKNNFREKVEQLPQPVKKVLLSNEIAEITFGINTSYGLNSEQQGKVAQITGQIFVKEIPMEKFLEALRENINLPQEILAGVATSLAKEIFLPLKNHFGNLELLINQWQAKASSPKYKKQSLNLPKAAIKKEEEVVAKPQTGIIKKDIRSILNEFPEIGRQLIGAQPIKVADFEAPVHPSVKNWLKDYIQQKGAGYHSTMERSDYLYRNPHAQKLDGEDKRKLNQILKSYDENAPLSISLEGKEILFEEEASQKPVQPSPVGPLSPSPLEPVETEPSRRDIYQEPIEEEPRPGQVEPRIEGNVVDLKGENNKATKYE